MVMSAVFITSVYLYLSLLGKFLSATKKSKLSRGEICVANFIPPANGASLGRFFVKNLG